MTKYWPAELAVKALQEEGVEVMFGILGGHIQAIIDYSYRAGIKIIMTRHEQAAVHAADGYARIMRKPGVCFATGGPGMLNMITGIHMAYVSRTPMVFLFGGHKEKESHRGAVQEAYAADICKSITKWTVRVTEPEMASYFIRKAFKDAMTPPYGPVGIEFPVDTFNFEPIEASSQIAYLPGQWRETAPARQATDPAYAQRAVELLSKAKRPFIIAGEGVHWSNAASQLQALAEKLQIPFNIRRLGRGAIPEDHPLSISGGARKRVIEEADVVLLLGLNVGYLESFGEWKTNAQFIQLQSCADDVLPTLPTTLEIVADPGMVLEQMLAVSNVVDADNTGKDIWTGQVRDIQGKFLQRMTEEAVKVSQDAPIHPRWLSKVVSDIITPDMTLVFDSFTASTFLGEHLLAKQGAQVLDAGLSAAFGHGIGMAIGAKLARPNDRVLVMMGDAGVGLGGGDIETAVRYDIPVVYLVYNDSALAAGLEQYAYGENFRVLGSEAYKGFRLTQDVRYDQMFAPLGCHVEHVESPADIAPALERAFASGKTAVINLIATRHSQHPLYESATAREMFWHLPADEVEEPVRKRHHEYLYPKFHNGKKIGE
ncbi:thiamine pyrophosphate-binding protein [Niveispirillum sp.]|uniref:thiamine pyrophosphate-binding protein n=1 Tax=Niveispirillum sp. TaxID=1917217 RepID=UPI001B6AF083|nr:thiamine pyrophosphate-binding protein [Niveispirillum sp.]MBP7335495.1 thiamine pyrophosphate-binding protein [Niveispirillum sp.]